MDICEDLGDLGYVKGKDGGLYEVCVDPSGKRVWINYEDGSSVARFNTTTGVDIHNSVTDQLDGKPQCLWCTHGKPTYQTWLSFIEKVSELYGLVIPVDAIKSADLCRT